MLKNLFFLLSGFITLAQQPGTVSVTVKDKTSGQPIAYASVLIKNAGELVTGGITADDGTLRIGNLSPKKYDVEIQYMGYKTHFATADVKPGENYELGTVSLADEAVLLNEVNVVAERSTIEQKIDRKVINVGKDLTTAGATASDIMNNIPSVNVDQDGNLSLRGNQNVRVLVDGRPTNIDPAQLLRQIPSGSIKKIELITNPSAKYNPEGMSGIINIVLHKNANDGFNANINTGLTFAVTPKINNSVNANYRTGKVNFFGTYGNDIAKRFNEGNISRLDNQSRQVIDIVNDDMSHLYKFGMDYYIDDKNTISGYTNQNHAVGTGNFDTDITYPDASENLFQRSIYDSNSRNGAYNVAYKRLFDTENRTLDLEINYNEYKEIQDASFDTQGADPENDFFYRDHIVDYRENTTVNLDYVTPIGSRSNFELGGEARILKSRNDYETTRPDSNSAYNYDLDIYSAYATFGQKYDKWSYQFGARFESYKVRATLFGNPIFEDDYITLYPSASFTYTPKENDMFQLSYSRRVDRPSLEQTKPAREFSTPLVTSVGNPELMPQFTNSVELNYTRKLEKGSVTAGIFARHIDNEISRILFPDETTPDDQDLIMTFDNFEDNFAFGFEASANYKITNWWDIQPSFDFSSITQKGLISVQDDAGDFAFEQREVSVSAWNARLNSNFKANKNLRFLLFGFYRSGVERIQNTSQEMYKIDAGGRYNFLKDKATLSIRFNDIFNTMRFAFEGENPYPTKGEFRWESQSVFVGLNFMFGAGKNRELQRKQREENTKQGGGGLF